MFSIIIVTVLSLVMWALGAYVMSRAIHREYFVVFFSLPVIPWCFYRNRPYDFWQYAVLASFFYLLSFGGIISIFI